MSFLYPTLAILAILAVFLFLIGRQNRDLLRVRAYGEFFLRLLPLLSTGVFILGLPVIMELAPAENPLPVLLVYLAVPSYSPPSWPASSPPTNAGR